MTSRPVSRFARFVCLAAFTLLTMSTAWSATKKKPAAPTPPPAPEPEVVSDDQKAGQNTHQSMAQVFKEKGAGGVESFWFAKNDAFTEKESPDVTHRGLDIEAQVDYDPAQHANSTLISQGNPQLGWAIHFINGKPAFTINYEGLHTTLKADEALKEATRITVRGLLGLDGQLSLNVSTLKSGARGYAPMYNGFPRKLDQGGLQVGHSSGPLARETFPNSTNFDGTVSYVRLSLLPSLPPSIADTQPAKTTPAKTQPKTKGKKS